MAERSSKRQLVGQSAPFLADLEKIPYVAKWNTTVFITGETGTGEELCGRAMHYLGPPACRFVPMTCGAIHLDLSGNEV